MSREPVASSGEITPRVGVVAFAFGVARAQVGEAVPGLVLIRLLADLGISGPAARSLVLRMRREGWLTSERAGREARYRLAPVTAAAQARVEGQLRGSRPDWDGSFSGVLFTVPERHRSFRDRLRRSAQLLGYVTLRPGLLIAATDRYAELTGLLPPRPAGSQVLRTRLAFSPEDTRSIVSQLWDLDGLAARYRAVLAEAGRRISAAEKEPAAGAAAFRNFAAATLPLYQASADDPDLPAELLPADWPGPAIGPAIGRAFAAFGPALGDYLAAVTSVRSGPARAHPDRHPGGSGRPAGGRVGP
jgi:phenylacetic acid degradation operon negative regulatory protein